MLCLHYIKNRVCYVLIGQDMDLRHADPRMGRGDHDLRVMGGPAPPVVSVPGLPPVQPPQARVPASIPDIDG